MDIELTVDRCSVLLISNRMDKEDKNKNKKEVLVTMTQHDLPDQEIGRFKLCFLPRRRSPPSLSFSSSRAAGLSVPMF